MIYFTTIFHCSPALTFINLANTYTKSDLQVMNTTCFIKKKQKIWIQQAIVCYCHFKVSIPLLWSASFFECERETKCLQWLIISVWSYDFWLLLQNLLQCNSGFAKRLLLKEEAMIGPTVHSSPSGKFIFMSGATVNMKSGVFNSKGSSVPFLQNLNSVLLWSDE